MAQEQAVRSDYSALFLAWMFGGPRLECSAPRRVVAFLLGLFWGALAISAVVYTFASLFEFALGQFLIGAVLAVLITRYAWRLLTGRTATLFIIF